MKANRTESKDGSTRFGWDDEIKTTGPSLPPVTTASALSTVGSDPVPLPKHVWAVHTLLKEIPVRLWSFM